MGEKAGIQKGSRKSGTMNGFGVAVKSILVLLGSLLLLMVSSCEDMEGDFYEATLSKEGYLRMEVQNLFRDAIFLNTQECPDNYAAGLYGIERVLSEEVIQVRYEKSSVQTCYLMLLVTPCGLDVSNTVVATNLYRSVIRNCGLEPLGL